MPYRSYRKRRGLRSGFRKSRRVFRARSMRRRRTFRGRRRSFRRSRTFSRVKRFSGYAPQQRAIRRSRGYSKQTRVFGSGSNRGTIVTSRELLGTITKPLTNGASFSTGLLTRTAMNGYINDSSKQNNRFNVYPLTGKKQYAIPPNCKDVTDTAFNPLSTAGNNSQPSVNDSRVPYFYYDDATADGTNDALYCQSGTLTMLCSPQSGVLDLMNQQAKMYDKYRVLAVQFQYVTNCATSTIGTLQMAVNPNPTQVPVIDRNQMMKQSCSTANSLYTNGVLYYKPSREWKFTTSPTQTGQNNRNPDRFTDNFMFFARAFDTQDVAAIGDAAVLGYIYITYVVEFKNPSSNAGVIGNPASGNPLGLAADSAPGTKDEQMDETELMAEINKISSSADTGPPRKQVSFAPKVVSKRSEINFDKLLDSPVDGPEVIEYEYDDDSCDDEEPIIPIKNEGASKLSK